MGLYVQEHTETRINGLILFMEKGLMEKQFVVRFLFSTKIFLKG